MRNLMLIVPLVLLLASVTTASAQVVINEISSSTSPDWVEIYSSENVDISGWIIKDATGVVVIIPSGTTIGPGSTSFLTYDTSNRFNNAGDTVSIFKSDGTTLSDQITYGAELCAPDSSGSVGRYPDGNSTIERFSNSTKALSNNAASINKCPTPTPQATSKPTSTYKINEAKDESGNVLSNVLIYINGDYSHHYAPETFDFCDSGCDHGYGTYKFTLKKSGYEDFEVEDVINPGESYEESPVLAKSTTSQTTAASTIATPSAKPSASPTPKPTEISDPYITVINDGSEETGNEEPVLGITDSTENTQPSKKDNKRTIRTILSWILIILGLGVLSTSGYYFYVGLKKNKNKNGEEYKHLE